MIINKIEKLKDNKNKKTIDDEKIVTFDNVILENNLLYKKVIDKILYDKIVKDTSYYCLYNKTIKYILKRKRSEKEIVDYLKKEISDVKIIDSIISKLKNINLINDISYCRSFINDSIYLGKCGIEKIKKELLSQNIPINIIENELNNFDNDIFDEKLIKIIVKKIKSNKKYSNNYLKQKILNEMINLGYKKERVLEIINENLIDDDNIIKNEFEKLYKKYSKKYNKDDLYKKIKQNLLTRGFFVEDINYLIEKNQKD